MPVVSNNSVSGAAFSRSASVSDPLAHAHSQVLVFSE